MRIRFMGGADTVTGSQHIIEANGHRVLRDCGLYQGKRKLAKQINGELPFQADTIDAMILSHAHIDHCGNIPSLAKAGYAAPIHTTTATMALCDIMLRDAAKIQEQDAEYLNQKTSRKGYPPVEPLYTTADAEAALTLFKGHHYHDTFEVMPGIETHSLEAGHILGAELTVVTVRENGATHRIGFALDLGRYNLPLIRDPEPMGEVDVLVMESTYGDRYHGDIAEADSRLKDVIKRTYARGGKVIIPSFALERAQEILYHLASLRNDGDMPRMPVYLDSPMATAVTRVFSSKKDYLDEEFHELREATGRILTSDWIHFVSSVKESKELTASDKPAIVIAASGMCEHGRILHHLKRGIEDPRTSIAIVGYQAEHTLGRRLVEKQKEVRIFGDTFERRAEVHVLNSFSAHADRNDLLAYARQVKAGKTFLVHGETRSRKALAEALTEEGLGEVHLPKRGDVFEL